ncbi:MAG: NUDIX hydrolase [Hyphomicrobiales bacterium]|nr:NUDIX hydrolase [Hyphomicrobiales bacterium]
MAKVPDSMYRQSGVIPWRRTDDGIQVLLITSRKKKRWVLPKGVVEPGISPAASAAKEAMEEAGIAGLVEDQPLGTYRYQKWGGTCTVEVFAMKVMEEMMTWPEDSFRSREWISIAEAKDRVDEAELKAILISFSIAINR